MLMTGMNFQTRSRQNFDGDVGPSTRNFNDAMVRDRQFTTTITVWMEHAECFSRLTPFR
ncbi:hypothetical protein AALB64_12145 [Lachnospiraceae bacterium 45-P1]